MRSMIRAKVLRSLPQDNPRQEQSEEFNKKDVHDMPNSIKLSYCIQMNKCVNSFIFFNEEFLFGRCLAVSVGCACNS